ncbi:unnamed protein product, partial [Prorocentrum cordatum]
GALCRGERAWTGAVFAALSPGKVCVALPADVLAGLRDLFAPFAAGSGHAPPAAARWVAGTCAQAPSRLAAKRRLAASHAAGSPPFALWMRAMVHPEGLALAPLRRIGRARGFGPERFADADIKFDASPWSGGAAIFVRGAPSEYFA